MDQIHHFHAMIGRCIRSMVVALDRPMPYKRGGRRHFGANVFISVTTTPTIPHPIRDGESSDLKVVACGA
jgi:hypothetical protein